MKKIALLIMLLLPVVASAQDLVEIDGIYYNVIKKGKVAEVTRISYSYTGSVDIPATVTYEGVEFSVTSIGTAAFYGCSGLTSVTIPNSVKYIGSQAFQSCSGLTSVTIPNSVTSIGESAFYGCSGMTSVTIGNGVTSIGSAAFSDCSGLTSIKVDEGNTVFDSRNNCNAIIKTSTNTLISGCKNTLIPNSVTSIGEYAFSGCSGLTSVTIPNSVTSIGYCAFSNCTSLTSITIGSGVKTITDYAFGNCPELTDVYCYAENVPRIIDYMNYQDVTDAFNGSYIEYATLHVPTASIDAYKAVEPWKNFKTIMGLDGTIVETQKCATPTISYGGKKLTFSSATEGVEYVSEIKDTDIKKHYDSEVQLTATYEISVYATKAGWENSNVATATLVWGTATFTETTQENTQSAAPALTLDTPALITARGGIVTVSSEAEGLPVAVYATDGRMYGSTTVSNGQATVGTSLTDGSVAIVKLGQKTVKVVMR